MLTSAYRNLLQTLTDNTEAFRDRRLVAFHPMKGPGATVDTLYIGRALNGWHWEFTIEELGENFDRILDTIITDKHEADTYENRLAWVERSWQNKDGYNTAKSQFWQVIRQTSMDRKQGEDWWEHICWTNFAKIAPFGKNPTVKMSRILAQASQKLLQDEISLFQPTNIVCLSGLGYAAQLLATAHTTTKFHYEGTELEYVGDVNWGGNKTHRLIIAPHPQSRSSRRIAKEIKKVLL